MVSPLESSRSQTTGKFVSKNPTSRGTPIIPDNPPPTNPANAPENMSTLETSVFDRDASFRRTDVTDGQVKNRFQQRHCLATSEKVKKKQDPFARFLSRKEQKKEHRNGKTQIAVEDERNNHSQNHNSNNSNNSNNNKFSTMPSPKQQTTNLILRQRLYRNSRARLSPCFLSEATLDGRGEQIPTINEITDSRTETVTNRPRKKMSSTTTTPITPPNKNADGYHFTNLSDGTPLYNSSPFYSNWDGDDSDPDNDTVEGQERNTSPLKRSKTFLPSRSLQNTLWDQNGVLLVDESSKFPIAQSSNISNLGSVREGKTTLKESVDLQYNARKCGNGEMRRNAWDASQTFDESRRCSDNEFIEQGSKDEKDTEETEIHATTPNVPKFKDIIGHQSVKLRLDEVLLPLALPINLSRTILTGVRSLAASIFMYGPPGCGKTQLAKAIAGEARAAFLSIGPSDILSKYVGESEEAVRSVFAEAICLAKNNKGGNKCSVIFFDEIDALGQSRGAVGVHGNGATTQNDESGLGDNSSRRILAELLIQLTKVNTFNGTFDQALQNHRFGEDGNEDMNLKSGDDDGGDSISSGDTILGENDEFDALERQPNNLDEDSGVRIIVVAATNRPEDCDPALIRRFALQLQVGLPNSKDRRNMLKRSMKGIDHTITNKQLSEISSITDGWSGSDLQSLAREAAMAPVRECIRRAAQLKRRRYVSEFHSEKRKKMGNNKMARASSLREDTCDSDAQRNNEYEKVHHYLFTRSKKMLLEEFRNLRPVTMRDFKNALVFYFSRMYSNLYDSPLADLGWIEEGAGNTNTNCNGELIEHYDTSSDEDEVND